MNLSKKLFNVTAIAIPLICMSLVLILVNTQSSDRASGDSHQRPYLAQPQPMNE
ncbi:MAG TPA: hypothetical protein V6D50_15570 [Chroococcales cyanobacterium]